MGSLWTVQPDQVRLDNLEWEGHQFWLDVKRDLTEGERRRVMTAGFRGISQTGGNARRGPDGERDTEIAVDWTAQSIVRTLTWVVDWSLSDTNGNKLSLTRDTIDALHPGVYDVIEQALNDHIARREHEKKAPTGKPRLKATSA